MATAKLTKPKIRTDAGRISIDEAKDTSEPLAKAAKKKEQSEGRMSVASLRAQMNKSIGYEVAFDLQQDNPSDVIDWIPTGSRWLDSITCKGKLGGIPCGKIVEVAGLSSCVTEDTLVEVIIE